MKRIFDGEKMVAIDGEYEFELASCYVQIKAWKRWYFRKNSKYQAEIRLRCFCASLSPDFWKMHLELSVNNKLIVQYRICAEAYDVLQRNHVAETYPGIEFVCLENFEPLKKK
jgi:hypothetical protein